MSQPLEYLDLELKYVQNKLTLDNIPYYCFAEHKGFKHRFHSEDQQLNLLCDSTYSILNNLHACRAFGFHITDKFLNLSKKKNKKLIEISEKFEFIKQQQDLKKEPKKVEIETVQQIKRLEEKITQPEQQLNKLTSYIQKSIGNE